MSYPSIYLLLSIIVTVCDSTCFHEDQSTAPMSAYKVIHNIRVWLLCVKECYNDAQCIAASYKDERRICYLHVSSTVALPSCAVTAQTPQRRWVKTEINCQSTAPNSDGSFYAVDFVRTNLTREMGIDPCYPDRSFLHPELVVLDGVSPPCALTKPDGSPGPAYIFRGLDINGDYTTWGVSNLVRASYIAADNTWAFYYGPTGKHRYVAVYCAELGGDKCSCSTLPLYGTGTRPIPNVRGACPGQVLYINRLVIAPVIANMDGNTAMIFCSGRAWLAGDANGNSYTISQASCGP